MPSMGSVGDAYDNSVAESFFSTLEKKLLAENRFRTKSEARVAIFDFIECFYNSSRLHSSLGNWSPADHERMHYEKFSEISRRESE